MRTHVPDQAERALRAATTALQTAAISVTGAMQIVNRVDFGAEQFHVMAQVQFVPQAQHAA